MLADEAGGRPAWISEALGAIRRVGARAVSRGARSGSRSAPDLMQIPARQPTATAMAVVADVLSAGASGLGLGVSGPQVGRGLVLVCRSAAAGTCSTRVSTSRSCAWRSRAMARYDNGREWTLAARRRRGIGLGRPLKLLGEAGAAWIPVHLGVVGLRAVEQTGEIADGSAAVHARPGRAVRCCSSRWDRGLGGRSLVAWRAEIDVAPCVARWRSPDDLDAARERGAAVAGVLPGRRGAPSRRTSTSSWRRARGTATRRASANPASAGPIATRRPPGR